MVWLLANRDTIFISAEDSFNKDTQAFPLMVVPITIHLDFRRFAWFEISEDNQLVTETLVLSHGSRYGLASVELDAEQQPPNGHVDNFLREWCLVDYQPDGNILVPILWITIMDLDDENVTDLIRVEVMTNQRGFSSFYDKFAYIDAVIDYPEYLIGFIDGDPGDSVSIITMISIG